MKPARDPYFGSTGYAAKPGRLFPVNVTARREIQSREIQPREPESKPAKENA